jgi:enhancer of polycomb-like protein
MGISFFFVLANSSFIYYRYLRHTMTLFSDMDHAYLLTDPTLVIQGAEGGSQIFLPYRLGMLQQPMLRRGAQGAPRPLQPTMNGVVPAHPIAGVATINGHQIKKMPPPNTGLQMRIPSNGGMRPPMTPVSNLPSNGGSSSPAPHQMSLPQILPVPVAQHFSPMTDSRPAISLPQVDAHKSTDIISPPAIPNDIALATLPQPDVNGSGNVEVSANGSPPHPKPQPPTPQSLPQQHLGTSIPTNGYHLTPLAAAYSHSQSPPQFSNISNGGGGLSQQQMRDLKSAFANMPAADLGSLQNASRVISSPYMHLGPNGANMNGIQLLPGANIGNLKLSSAAAAAKQMPWGTMATPNATGSPIMQMQQIPIQRPGSVVNGNHLMDAQLAVNGGNALSSPSLGVAGLPVSPSANGMRSGLRNGMLVNGQTHSISPLTRHSSSPLPNISHSHSQSPTKMPMTPNMAIIGSSPSLQH